jgi:hypothetical protein
MNRTRTLGFLFSAALTLSANADTSIGAGTTLAVTNSETLGIDPVQLNDGVTLVFPDASAGVAGLNEYTRTNATTYGTPDVTGYGDWTRITTNAYWADTNITKTLVEYTYTGRWYIPSAGTYSLFEHIDDQACIAVDGMTLLRDVSASPWNTPTCIRDVPLSAGWHDLEIRLYNGAAGGGPGGGLACGILYSPSNDLIGVSNLTNAFPFADSGDGSVLRNVRNGHASQKFLVSGTATFDLTAHDMAVPFRFGGGLLTQTNAASPAHVVIAGADEVVFGTRGLAVNFPPFDMDVAFTGVANPQGVTFSDQSTVIKWPTSCPWRIADNATVALWGTNMLGTGDVALTNHNLYALSASVVAAGATLRVQGTNLTVSMKPCWLDALRNWGGVNATVTNNLSLEGVNAAAAFPNNADFFLQGVITGTGTVSKTGAARTEFLVPCDFVGTVSCGDTGLLAFDAATAGNSNNAVTVGATAAFALYPPGYGTTDTTAWIQTLHGSGTGGKVCLPAKQTLTVDTLDGAVSVQGTDASSVLCVRHLATNATLNALGNVSVVLENIGSGTSVVLTNATTSLTVTGTGQTLDTLTLGTGAISVSGAFTVGLLNGAGTFVKTGGGTLRLGFCTKTTDVRIDAGKLLLSGPSSENVLGNLPAFWLDATATNVFTQYKNYVFTNNFLVISNWFDCRPGAPFYGYNSRGEDNFQIYPYVMTNNQNGLSVVSMGSYQLPLSAAYGSRTEARRLPLSATLYPQYVVMMFGSQNGGGAAAIGGNANLRRGGSTDSDYRNPSTPILSVAYPVWTNGVSVTATNTGFTGGYQILTINTQGQGVNALGWKDVYTTAGGQNYGEVLVYTNALTTMQRFTAEYYLAKKWGLPYANTTVPTVTVASGAALEIDGGFSVGQINGAGTVSFSTNTAFQLTGLFSGTVALNGGVLSVPNLLSPPDAACVPSDNRSGWFDPDTTNRVVFGGAYTPTRPLAIAALLDRVATNHYLLGTAQPNLSIDRRPWLSVTNGPWDTPQYWMDYRNIYANDVNGNTLRLMRDFSSIGGENTTAIPTNVQSGFIVLDSSRGGGTPIAYDVGASQTITRSNPNSAASPIWGSATTTLLKSGLTCLDGTAVDGATQGYSGKPELLSFQATNVFKAAYFGYYGSGEGTSPGPERLGEIILFNTALNDTARADIEAYLMKKWLGKARAGYSDSTSAKISGNGIVQVAKPSQLPIFDSGFSGTVALSGTSFDYTLTTNAAGVYAVSPATAIPGGLSVAATGTVNVAFAIKPPAGTYTLATYGSIANGGFANWTLSTTGTQPSGRVLLKPTATALTLYVVPQGTVIRVL